MQNTFTPERRLEIYKKAQVESEEYDYGRWLCILIGDIAYSEYPEAPWTYWDEMQQYLPELRRFVLSESGLFTPTQRREILESAIAEVTELIKSKP
jgi:hypothetical protein